MENDLTGDGKENSKGEALGIERINGFSDAVFAVAITLLILTIDVPEVSDISQLPTELKALWPKFMGFLISFAIIGAFWVSHHVIFRLIERHKPWMLWLNLVFLMFIVLLPFSTDLLSEYSDSVLAIVFYDLNMIAASLSLCLLWWYVSYRNRLVSEDLNPALRRHLLLNYLNMAIIFAGSLGIAFLNTSASQYLYFLLIPNGIVLERIRRKGVRNTP